MTKTTKAYLAVAFVSIAWGTTYLAIRVGVLNYPAFLFAGMRQVISGIIMAAIALGISRKVDMSWATTKHNIISGFLLIGVGNGIVSYAEKYIPSGVAALICSLMPLNAVLLNLFISRTERLNTIIVAGLASAFAGVVLIFKDNLADLANPAYLWGIVAIYIGTISWAWGSIKNSKLKNAVNPLFNSAMQLLWGGIFLLMASPAMDTFDNFNPWQPDAINALIYLIVVGSILSYSAYMYALKILPVGVVTLYAYINPLVAVILGYFILAEKLTWYTGWAFVTIVFGVYLVNQGYKREKAGKALKQNAVTPAVE